MRVRLHVGDQPDALLVPQAALGSSQLGKYVYVADNGKARAADGVARSDLWRSHCGHKGVTAGDAVIIGNLQKIGPGAPVRPIAGPRQAFSRTSAGAASG